MTRARVQCCYLHVIDDETLAVLLFAAIAAAALLSAVNRWPAVAAMFVLAILEQQLQVDMRVLCLGAQVSPNDLLYAGLGIAGGWRWLAKRGHDKFDALALALVAALAVAFLRGADAYGFETAANFYRRFFYLSVGIFYLVGFEWRGRDCDAVAWIATVAAASLAVLAVLEWLFPDLDLVSLLPSFSLRAYEARRVLPADSALLLAQAGLVGFAIWLRGRIAPGTQIAGAVLLVVMLLLYHRSVWVVFVLALLLLAVLNHRVLWRAAVPLLLLGLVFGLTLMLGIGFGRAVFLDEIASAVAEPLAGGSTLDWRVEGWQALLRRMVDGGPAAWLFGSGFGVGYERFIAGNLVIYSPHNFYIELLLNGGLAALALWLAVPVLALLRLWRDADAGGRTLNRDLAVAWLAMILVYGVPYSPSSEQAVLIAAAVGMAARGAQTERHARFVRPPEIDPSALFGSKS